MTNRAHGAGFTWRLCLIATLIGMCAATSNAANGGSGAYKIYVEATAAPDADSKGRMYYLTSGMKDVNDDDLRFREFAGYIENAITLSKKGFVRVASIDKADLIVRMGYVARSPQQSKGVTFSWKQLQLIACDLKSPSQAQVWTLFLSSRDGSVDGFNPGIDSLREMMPYLAVTAMAYVGKKPPDPSKKPLLGRKNYAAISFNNPLLTEIVKNKNSQGGGDGIEKNKNVQEVGGEPFGPIGVRFFPTSRGLLVVQVYEGTPASRAGVQARDLLAMVGSENANLLLPDQVAQRLSQAKGPTQTITVVRQGYSYPIVITLTKAGAGPAQPQVQAQAQPQTQTTPKIAVASPEPAQEAKKTVFAPAWDKEVLKTVFAPNKDQTPFRGTMAWGINRMQESPDGVLILEVSSSYRAAAQAGLVSGDIIVAVDGSPVKTPQDLTEKIKLSLPYTPVNITVERSGTRVETSILPRGVLRLEVKDVDPSFTIPGVPPVAASRPVSAIDAFENINVLKEVIIDRASGQIEIIGSYDPKYATGPIPYLDLLKTALKYPEPVLNLISERSDYQQIHSRKNVYEIDVASVLFKMPAAERERQSLIRGMAFAYGITPEEYVQLYNYCNIDAKGGLAPPEIGRILVKVLRHLGHAEVAAAYEWLPGNNAASFAQALKILGKEAEAGHILADQSKDMKQAENKLLALACITMMDALGLYQPGSAGKLMAAAQAGEIKAGNMLASLYSLAPTSLNDKSGRDLIAGVLNKVVVGDAPTRVFTGKGDALPVRIETIDVDRNSRLARIMYEADYAGKTFLLRPDLFKAIPGQTTYSEYISSKMKELGKDEKGGWYLDAAFWFEPKRVEMQVSPDKNVVSFGASEIKFTTKMDNVTGSSKQEAEKLFGLYKDWCAQYTDNYELYAQAMPAFHNLREAAKVIALARWLNSEKIALDMGSVRQERWDAPETVSGYWRWVAPYAEIAPRKFVGFSGAGITGGVSFKEKSNWTSMTPSVQSETKVSDQLVLSSQIGQKAVKATEDGDLENARYLAELSAQALTGGVSRSDLAKMNIILPEAKSVPVSPVNMQLQKEMIKETNRQITELKKDPASRAQATATLRQIRDLYKQAQDNPVSASDYLHKLQTGRLPALPVIPSPKSPVVAEPAVWAPCSDPAIQDTAIPLSSERREFLNKQLAETKDRLKYINEALKKLMALNEGQRAEIEKMTGEITAAYDESVDRAWSVVFDLLASLPVDKFLDNYNVAKSKLEDAMKYRTGLLTTPLDEAAKKEVQSEILRIQIAKGRLDEIYKRSQNLLDVFKVSNYAYDIDKWNQQEQGDYKKVKDAALVIGKLALDYPKLEEYLKTKKFFAAEKYYQVLAMGRMAYYGTGFFLDILAQQLVWQPMVGNIQNDIKYNIQGMDYLREKAANTYREIGCIEKALRQ